MRVPNDFLQGPDYVKNTKIYIFVEFGRFHYNNTKTKLIRVMHWRTLVRSFVRSFYVMGFEDVGTDNSVPVTPALLTVKHI